MFTFERLYKSKRILKIIKTFRAFIKTFTFEQSLKVNDFLNGIETF
jgi:hypothetical protein